MSSFWFNVGIFRLVHELIGKLSARKESFKVNKISVSQLGQLIDLVEAGTITRSSFYSIITDDRQALMLCLGTSGKLLLRHLLDNPSQASVLLIARELNLLAFSHGAPAAAPDEGKDGIMEQLCAQAIEALPAEVDSFRKGNVNVLNRIVGRVMKDSRGRANAQAARTVIERIIKGEQ